MSSFLSLWRTNCKFKFLFESWGHGINIEEKVGQTFHLIHFLYTSPSWIFKGHATLWFQQEGWIVGPIFPPYNRFIIILAEWSPQRLCEFGEQRILYFYQGLSLNRHCSIPRIVTDLWNTTSIPSQPSFCSSASGERHSSYFSSSQRSAHSPYSQPVLETMGSDSADLKTTHFKVSLIDLLLNGMLHFGTWAGTIVWTTVNTHIYPWPDKIQEIRVW